MAQVDSSVARIIIRTKGGKRIVVDPQEIYYLDASEGDSVVRLRGRQEMIDVRRLEELEAILGRHGFLRIHRSYLVNLRRIAEIRTRGRDLEVRLTPPVNKILPVSREAAAGLLAAYGEQ